MRSIEHFFWTMVLAVMFLVPGKTRAQSFEAQQLILNVEKLSQLKNILRDMEQGYTVIRTGYQRVKDIAQGNFSLHELFLDGLLLVSPEVKKYRRVLDIMNDQKRLLNESGSMLKRFKSGGKFSLEELDYLKKVYDRLLSGSLDNLEGLLMVVTASQLRMSDEERLRAIDQIFADMEDKLLFLHAFNRDNLVLESFRAKQQADLGEVAAWYRKEVQP